MQHTMKGKVAVWACMHHEVYPRHLAMKGLKAHIMSSWCLSLHVACRGATQLVQLQATAQISAVLPLRLQLLTCRGSRVMCNSQDHLSQPKTSCLRHCKTSGCRPTQPLMLGSQPCHAASTSFPGLVSGSLHRTLFLAL